MKNNILYIEDNPDNMRLIQRALESRGYRLLQAGDGLTGVQMAESQAVDLILLDINLPDIDGYEVARRLRASSIGFFIFIPPAITKKFIEQAGFKLIRCEDVTGNIELTSGRWHASRQKHREDLIKIEGEERFEGLQKFFSTVHQLTSERRLSRFVFVGEKQGN